MRTMNQNYMSKLVVGEWLTLDGVFDADTMNQWFDPYHSDDRGAYIQEVVSSSGVLLLGKKTYEMFAAYWPHQKNDEMGPASKLNSMPKYVVSPTLKAATWNNSTIIRGNVVEEIKKLKEQPGGDLLVSGSATLVQSLMEAGLVDEYKFLVQPIIVGSGKRFFKDGRPMARMKLVETKTFSLGVIALRYKPAN